MKTKIVSSSILASTILALTQSAHASLLVGWHKFDRNNSLESPDAFATGFSGTISKPLQSRNLQGDNGGVSGIFYGDSTIASGSGSDGFLRIGNNVGSFLTLTNNSGSAVSLSNLFFDAIGVNAGNTVTAGYRYGNGNVLNGDGLTTLGVFGSLPNTGGDANLVSADFADLSQSLVGLNLGIGQTIQFNFVSSSTAFIDNIAITAISAIPEPASLMALGCVLGSGLLLRNRRRPAGQCLQASAC